MKTINEHWTKFFLRAYWQRAANDPDLIYLAPCMILMGLILPWVFRLLAVIIMPLMVGLGSLLFLVAVVQKVKRMIRR
ncbi:MAG: hypothetical protein LDL41_05745 [Coleofasciculus sp. S288]|nr:hypothetical protein [Coleofasciculus sp. S288]